MWSSSSPCSCQFGNGNTHTCCLIAWHWELWVFLSEGRWVLRLEVGCLGARWPPGSVRCCVAMEEKNPPSSGIFPVSYWPMMGGGEGDLYFPPDFLQPCLLPKAIIYVYVHIVYVQRPALCTWGPKGAWDPLVYPWLHQHAGHR